MIGYISQAIVPTGECLFAILGINYNLIELKVRKLLFQQQHLG